MRGWVGGGGEDAHHHNWLRRSPSPPPNQQGGMDDAAAQAQSHLRPLLPYRVVWTMLPPRVRATCASLPIHKVGWPLPEIGGIRNRLHLINARYRPPSRSRPSSRPLSSSTSSPAPPLLSGALPPPSRASHLAFLIRQLQVRVHTVYECGLYLNWI